MKYISEIIIAVLSFATASGFGAFINAQLKQKIRSLEISKDKEAIIKLNDRIDLFEKIIENLNNMIADIIERMDKKDDREVLMIEIQTKANEIISIKELENGGLKHLIFNGIKEFNNFIKIIYASNFSTSVKDLKEIAYNLLKLVKHQSDWTTFFADSNILLQFLTKLENQVIIPLLDDFIINYSEIIQLSNGVRRKKFATLCKDFVSDIIKGSIDLFNQYQ